MLVYRAWLETRARFAAGAVLLALLSAYTVLGAPDTLGAYAAAHPGGALTYGEYVWLQLHAGYAQTVWIFCALILGNGGLPRERAAGTASLTLSLPVSRSRLLAARMGVCVAELAALALVPAAILSALSPLVGESYPVGQSLLFSTAMVGGGLVFLGVGSLLPHFFEGDLTAPTVGFAVAGAWFFIGQIPSLRWLNVFNLMSGAGYLDVRTLFFQGSFPWLGLLASTSVAAGLLGCAAMLAMKEDF